MACLTDVTPHSCDSIVQDTKATVCVNIGTKIENVVKISRYLAKVRSSALVRYGQLL